MAWTVVNPDEQQSTTSPPEQQPASGWTPVEQQPWSWNDLARRSADALTFGQWNRVRAGVDAATSDKSYWDALQGQAKESQAADQRLPPLMRGTADVIGGTTQAIATAPLMGGQAINAVASPLWKRAATGAALGGSMGAAQGAGQTYTGVPSDYIENAAKSGGMGFVLGGAIPVLGAGAKKAYSFLADDLPAPLIRAVEADRAGVQTLTSRGPRAMLPDAGPSMLGTAQGTVTGTGGPGKTALTNALDLRNRTAAPTITREVTDTFGPARPPSAIEGEVRGRMQGMSPAYTQVLNNARAVDTNPIALHLEGEIGNTKGPAQAALREVRAMLDIPTNPGTLDPNPRALQATREAVRGMRDNPNADPTVRAQMGRVYDRITREMQDKIPGIRQLDSQYAELGAQERALQPGSDARRTLAKGDNAVWPAEMRDRITEAAQPKGVNIGPSAEPLRVTQAVRGELERIVGTNKNDLLALENVLGQPHDWNAQKLGLVFGQERADRLMNTLQNERQFRDTHQAIVGGSKTATTTAAKEELDASQAKLPWDTTLWGTVLRTGKGAVDALMKGSAERSRDRIAGLMASQGPELQALIPRLLSAAPTQQARDNIVRMLTENPALTGAVGAVAGSDVEVPKKPKQKRN